jgi:outer membrane protein
LLFFKLGKPTQTLTEVQTSAILITRTEGEKEMKDRKAQMRLIAGAAIVCLIAIFSSAAYAADVSLGAGVGLAPDYEGSEDYQAVPLPYVSVAWSNHMAINLLGNKAKVNLIPSPIWKGGLIGEYIAKRDDVDNSRVDRLEDVDASVMLGGFFGFEYANWSASIEAMQDVADGNDGAIVRLNGGYRIPIDQSLSFSLGAFTTWADEDYMSAYFSIDGADSARSGLQTFDADAGFKDVGLNLTASYKPWEHWGFMGLASYKRLLGDAEDSPVVDDEGDANQFSGGVLLYYKF